MVRGNQSNVCLNGKRYQSHPGQTLGKNERCLRKTSA